MHDLVTLWSLRKSRGSYDHVNSKKRYTSQKSRASLMFLLPGSQRPPSETHSPLPRHLLSAAVKGKWRVTSREDSAGFGGVASAQGQGHTGKASRFCPINHLIYTLQLLHGQETSLHFIGEATVR